MSHYGSIKFITNGRKNFHQIILPVFLEKVDWSLAYEWLKSSSLTLGILVLRALGYSAYSLSSKRMVRVLLSCWEALAAAACSAFALKPSQLKIFPNVEDFSCVLSRSPTGSLFSWNNFGIPKVYWRSSVFVYISVLFEKTVFWFWKKC